MCKTVGYAPLVPRCTLCILAIQLQNILCIETGSDMHKVSHTWIHWGIWGGHLCNLHEVVLHCSTVHPLLPLFYLVQLLCNFLCNAYCSECHIACGSYWQFTCRIFYHALKLIQGLKAWHINPKQEHLAKALLLVAAHFSLFWAKIQNLAIHGKERRERCRSRWKMLQKMLLGRH